jgi:protein-tyrosine phosphatase
MIDIHAHVLPNVDDGPSSWDESIAMLRKAEKDGVKGIVCTSHVLNCLDRKISRDLSDKFKTLQRWVKEDRLKLSLWLGSEIHVHARFDPKDKIATLNGNGKYILMELPLGEFPNGLEGRFFQLSIDGYSIILAHPERNNLIVQNPGIAAGLVRSGILLQVNAGSVTGVFGKRIQKTANKLIDRQLVHFIASDGHSVRNRPIALSKAYHLIREEWGESTAERLFQVNPMKALHGDDIEIQIPAIKSSKKRGSKLIRFSWLKKE